MAMPSVRFIMEPGEYRAAWCAYCGWVRSEMSSVGAAGATVHLGALGSMAHRRYALGIQIATFTLHEHFARKYGLRQRTAPFDSTLSSGGSRRHANCPADRLAERAGLRAEQAVFAVESVLRCIGELGGAGLPLDLHMGVGRLLVLQGDVAFLFEQHGADAPLQRTTGIRWRIRPLRCLGAG